MEFRLDLNYASTQSERDIPGSACKTREGLTREILLRAFAAKFHPNDAKEPQGLKGRDRKTLGRLLNAITDAVDAGEQVIDVSEDSIEFARKIVEDWVAPSNWAGWVTTLEDALDEAHERIKAKQNGAAKPVALAKD